MKPHLIVVYLLFTFSLAHADDVADAKVAFSTMVKYQKTDDIRSLDLFAPDVVPTFNYTDGRTTKTVVVPSTTFLLSIKQEIAMERGNPNTYQDVKYAQEGAAVRVTANVVDTAHGRRTPFMALYKRDRGGVFKIKELKTTIFVDALPAKDPMVHTPAPSYPPDAVKALVTGSGKCAVEFDASGHVVHAAMTPSTWSKMLDENTLTFARKHWIGKPNTKLVVPITYTLPMTEGEREFFLHNRFPLPPYPEQERMLRHQGNGVVRVTFDASGRVVNAIMARSTSYAILDENTISFAIHNWRSSEGKKRTVLIPITYLLR